MVKTSEQPQDDASQVISHNVRSYWSFFLVAHPVRKVGVMAFKQLWNCSGLWNVLSSGSDVDDIIIEFFNFLLSFLFPNHAPSTSTSPLKLLSLPKDVLHFSETLSIPGFAIFPPWPWPHEQSWKCVSYQHPYFWSPIIVFLFLLNQPYIDQQSVPFLTTGCWKILELFI